MPKKINKYLYWTPRIASIAFILFLAVFSLDVFGNGTGFWQTLGALLIHNIPSFVLLIVLLFSWKHEIVGGVAFILAGLLYIFLLFRNPQFEWHMISWLMIIAGPAFAIGLLFLAGWSKKKR